MGGQLPGRSGRGAALLVAALAGVACTRPSPTVAPPPAPWHQRGPAGGNRPISDLDVSRNGQVDLPDWQAFDGLAAAALARLRALGADPTVAGGYYQGPAEHDTPALALAPSVSDVSSVPDGRLRELWVEARWMALQARLVAVASAPLGAVVGGMLAGSVSGYRSDELPARAVCELALRVDTSAYERAGLTPSAVLDVDSTVWLGNGTDVFMAAIIALGLPRPEANPALKAFLKTVPGVDAAMVERNSVLQNAELLFGRATSHDISEAQRISDKDAFYSLVALLEGVSVADAREAARVAVQQGAHGLPPWKTRVLAEPRCSTAQLVGSLLARGVDVYFLSATPDVMVEAAAELFGLLPGHALGSALEVEGDRYTGRVKDNPYAIKAPVVRQWLPSPPLVAFGDSPTSDFPMLLEATGVGFMINPRPTFLTRDATEAGGRLVSLRFEHTVSELAGEAPAAAGDSTAQAP